MTKPELFADTLPREVDAPLFAPNPDSPARVKRKPAPRPPRWRDEDMPLRAGDVIAVGLDSGRCPIGQVAAVNDHCFRLNGYTLRGNRFTAGIIVIGWRQVVEYGPVARRLGDYSHDMDPLLTYSEAWQDAALNRPR